MVYVRRPSPISQSFIRRPYPYKEIFMKLYLTLAIACLAIILAFTARWQQTATAVQDDQAVASPPTSSATDAAGLVGPSDVIVTGTCTNLESLWINDGRNLVTLATINVSDVLKGSVGSTITVVLPGGTDANRRIPVAMSYPGAPTIGSDEEVFLFLTHEEQVADAYAVVGFAQGKFSIVTDDQGEKLVSRDRVEVNPQSGTGVVRGTRTMVPLNKFKEDVKRHVQ